MSTRSDLPFMYMETWLVWSCYAHFTRGVKIGVHYIAI